MKHSALAPQNSEFYVGSSNFVKQNPKMEVAKIKTVILNNERECKTQSQNYNVAFLFVHHNGDVEIGTISQKMLMNFVRSIEPILYRNGMNKLKFLIQKGSNQEDTNIFYGKSECIRHAAFCVLGRPCILSDKINLYLNLFSRSFPFQSLIWNDGLFETISGSASSTDDKSKIYFEKLPKTQNKGKMVRNLEGSNQEISHKTISLKDINRNTIELEGYSIKLLENKIILELTNKSHLSGSLHSSVNSPSLMKLLRRARHVLINRNNETNNVELADSNADNITLVHSVNNTSSNQTFLDTLFFSLIMSAILLILLYLCYKDILFCQREVRWFINFYRSTD